jgi:hypothetical protein
MQTYRSPRWSRVTAVVLFSFLALIAVSIAIHPGNAAHSGTAPGYIAFGTVLAAFCIFLMVCALAERLVLTEQGLTWRHMLRTRNIAWASIQDVLVVPAASAGHWFSPAVKADGRLIRINSVLGSRRYIENVVTAIREARAAAAPDITA